MWLKVALDRCLSPSRPEDALTTLQGLSNVLGRERTIQVGSEGLAFEAGKLTPPSPGMEEVNEFLAHLNGCSDRNIFVIVATNEPEKIDPAVRRTGRLDKLIYVGPPDLEARQEMLSLHLRGRPAAGNLNIEKLAATIEGYSVSDIRFLVDEAARDALRLAQEIDDRTFSSAMNRVQPSVTPTIEA